MAHWAFGLNDGEDDMEFFDHLEDFLFFEQLEDFLENESHLDPLVHSCTNFSNELGDVEFFEKLDEFLLCENEDAWQHVILHDHPPCGNSYVPSSHVMNSFELRHFLEHPMPWDVSHFYCIIASILILNHGFAYLIYGLNPISVGCLLVGYK